MPGHPDRFTLLFANEPQRLIGAGPVEPAKPRVAAIRMCTVISDPPTPYQRPVSVNRGDVFVFHDRLWMLEQNWCGYPKVRHLGSLVDAATALAEPGASPG